MEDENTKEENQPSTSKKESRRTNSGNDLYEDREQDDRASNSETSASATYSIRSRIDMADTRPESPKPVLRKLDPKARERKRKRNGRNVGRVEKRRRSYTRRQVRKAPVKRKPRVKEDRRNRDSISTIFTRLSSRSGSMTAGCIHCGHRCCRRRAKWFVVRFENRRRYKARRYKKNPKKKVLRIKKLKKKPVMKLFAQLSSVKEIQIGSRSHMLSPLFVNTNAVATAEGILMPQQTYNKITPEMLFEALSNLTMWKQEVQLPFIMEYIRRNYPVNTVETELLTELKEKLRVAAIVGIVVQSSDEQWSLSCELQQRKLTMNHVTLFWRAYADTLSPMLEMPGETVTKERIDDQTNTEHGRNRNEGFFCNDLI